jgi:hypothetical protein
MKIGRPHGELEPKMLKKRVHQWAEIVKKQQFPLQLEQNGKSKIFFFSKLSTNVKK